MDRNKYIRNDTSRINVYTGEKEKMFIKKILLALTVLVTTFAANASLIVVDTFEADQGPISALLGQTTFDSMLGNGILGGERDLTVTTHDVVIAGSGANLHVTGGNFAFNADAGATSSFTLIYDGIDGAMTVDANGLADDQGNGVDLTNGGLLNEFSTGIVLADIDFWWTVTFWWDNGQQMEALALPGIEAEYNGIGGFDSRLPFDYFTNVDFTDITAIAIEGNTISPDTNSRTASFDVVLDNIDVVSVPEPAPVALLGMGLLCMGAMARKRNNK